MPSTPSQSGEWLVLGSRRWGGAPPPGLVTGYRNPFPALLLVVGPEQRGLRIGAP